jgi:hypothetical protein
MSLSIQTEEALIVIRTNLFSAAETPDDRTTAKTKSKKPCRTCDNASAAINKTKRE